MRHVQDCAQLQVYLPDRQARIIDLGTGGGFPGLVLVSLGYEQVTLVDSDRRKISACRTFLRDQGLGAELIVSRIESLDIKRFDIVTARALASLDQLIAWSLPLLANGGRCLFLKGARVDEEIAKAQTRFCFSYEKHPSLSSPSGYVLEVCHVRIREA